MRCALPSNGRARSVLTRWTWCFEGEPVPRRTPEEEADVEVANWDVGAAAQSAGAV